jgi:hypothetical protein
LENNLEVTRKKYSRVRPPASTPRSPEKITFKLPFRTVSFCPENALIVSSTIEFLEILI